MAKHSLEDINVKRRIAWCTGCDSTVTIRFRSDTKKWRCQTSEQHNDRKRKYGMSKADFDNLYELQKGACQICGGNLNHSLNVDHDHKTGRVRGLLCSYCNTGLGLFRDDVGTLAKAIAYLVRS